MPLLARLACHFSPLFNMTSVTKFWPILTATHRYDKSISTYKRGVGQMIEAPILAYLIETTNGRILYDVGCDYRKINDTSLREKYYNAELGFGAPVMDESQRLPNQLAKMGLSPKDIDVVFIGHLHFDHAGGLCDFCGAEVHVQADEIAHANCKDDVAYEARRIRLGDRCACNCQPGTHGWAYVAVDRNANGCADYTGGRCCGFD
jgi:N-acyl homoserine lactone hydrolase